jgi:hypothetical protein
LTEKATATERDPRCCDLGNQTIRRTRVNKTVAYFKYVFHVLSASTTPDKPSCAIFLKQAIVSGTFINS